MVKITPKPEPVVENPDEVVLVTDVEALTAGTTPGCGDDNPYN
ncbi:hypothetical protein [Streptomyces coerulescens]|uniref:Uncharacterized protein n=1 Tax=Streptomyces coerulescens TaxID=29304 RepID=A0ABW0CSF0_STRCD